MEYLDRECGKYLATKLKSYVYFDSNSKQMVIVYNTQCHLNLLTNQFIKTCYFILIYSYSDTIIKRKYNYS